jgi:hypothetical protein
MAKQRITAGPAFNDIDCWDAMETATDLFPPLYHLWVSKHVSGFFGIGTMMRNWGFWEHSKCPCCHHVREDTYHLLKCPDADCAEAWLDSLMGFEAWIMIETDTAPEIEIAYYKPWPPGTLPSPLWSEVNPGLQNRGFTQWKERSRSSGGNKSRRTITDPSTLAGLHGNGWQA